jgi:hypothetical protein
VKAIPLQRSLSLTVDYDRTAGDGVARLTVAVRDQGGLMHMVDMGELQPGASTPTADLPMCVDAACSLEAITFTRPVGAAPSTATGTVTLSGATDGTGAVDLTPAGADGWRSGAGPIPFPIPPGADVAVTSPGRVVTSFTLDSGTDAAIQVADNPSRLPIIVGSTMAEGASDGSAFLPGLDGEYIPVLQEGSGVVPRTLRKGSLADLEFALAAMGRSPLDLDYQVWLSPGAPASIRTSLEASGFAVTTVDSVDQRVDALGRGGTALALQMFLIAALVALVIGAGTMLANTFVVVRRRAYELAALRSLGASHAVLVRSGRREQVALALTGAVIGALSGLVGAALALPALLQSASADYPAPWFGPAWGQTLALVAAILVLLVVVADVGARRTARRARIDLLREVQE